MAKRIDNEDSLFPLNARLVASGTINPQKHLSDDSRNSDYPFLKTPTLDSENPEYNGADNTKKRITYPKFDPPLWHSNPNNENLTIPKLQKKPIAKNIPRSAIFLLVFSLIIVITIGYYNYNDRFNNPNQTPTPSSSVNAKDLPGTPFEAGKYANGRWEIKEYNWGDNYVDLKYEITMDQGRLSQYNIFAFVLQGKQLLPQPSINSPYLPSSSVDTSEPKNGWVRFYTDDDELTVILATGTKALSAIKITR